MSAQTLNTWPEHGLVDGVVGSITEGVLVEIAHVINSPWDE
jgi:hypothetical protein